jgi:hypothetical protein
VAVEVEAELADNYSMHLHQMLGLDSAMQQVQTQTLAAHEGLLGKGYRWVPLAAMPDWLCPQEFLTNWNWQKALSLGDLGQPFLFQNQVPHILFLHPYPLLPEQMQ